MRLRRLCVHGALAAAILSQPALAQPATAISATQADNPIDILAAAGDAARMQNFEGVVIYRDNRSLDALRVIHRFKNGHESERVTALNGESRDLVREDDRVICILPKDRHLQLARPALKGFLMQMTPEHLRDLSAWYEFKALGTTRVAARPCVGAAVLPRDGYRYGYELWADQETGVPLKFSLLSPDGHILEQLMFTEVSFPAAIPDETFQIQANTGESRIVQNVLPPPLPLDVAKQDDSETPPQWRFGKLPPGFHVAMRDDEELPDGSGHVSHTLLTDGLTTISVFSNETVGNAHGLHGMVRRGSFQAYGRVVGSFHVTIVGDAPALTVREIGDSLQPALGASEDPAAINPLSTILPAPHAVVPEVTPTAAPAAGAHP